jgi:N-acetylmuramoyl-L-alanine amidase
MAKELKNCRRSGKVKKLIASSVLASSILFPTITSADTAPFPVKMKVEKKANIRKGATASYSIVKSLNTGQLVTVIDEFTNSSGEKWYRIDLGSIKGWAKSTTFSKNAAVSNDQYGTINGSKVNVRKGASTSYKTVDTLSNGKKVKVIDSFKNNKNEIWYRIEYGKLKGWVIGEFLKTSFSKQSTTQPSTATKTVYVTSAVIRKGATTSYPSIGTVTKNQKVSILGVFTNAKNEEWFRIKSGSKVGWVIGTAFSKPSTTPVNTNIKEIQVNKAVIRKGASDSYKIVANLSKKQKVKIIDTYTSSQGQKWYRVEYGKIKGWVESTAFENLQIKEILYVGTHNTYLYAGTSYKNKTIEKIPFKSKVNVLKEIQISVQTWVQIQTQSGKFGYAAKTELFKSTTELKYVFALNKAVIRKGASTNYAVASSLKENDQLLIINEVNGWLNIETTSGTRGWILKEQTSPFSLKRFITPTTYKDGNDSYLVWQKPMNFKFTYSTTSNQLKITQGITDVEAPSFNVLGIKTVAISNTSGNEKSIILTFEPGYTFTIRNFSNKVVIKVLPTGILGKKIIVDAGHGGDDTGAIGPKGLKEKEANLGTALFLKDELEKAGAIVTLTRSNDTFLELWERTDIANLSNADAFISIHSDSFSTTSIGTTTYFNTSVNFNGPRSRALGECIQKTLYTSLNTYNRGVKEQDFYVNRMNELPSILVELAFISNPKEEALLDSDTFRQKAAIGIRKGLEQYFNNF